MIFRINQKLGKKIKVAPSTAHPEHKNPFADWSAHLFTADRVQYIIIANTKSLYSIIIHGQGITDDSTFINRALSAMREFMKSDWFQFQFERFIVPETHTVSFSKNTNRAVIGSMNELIFEAKIRLVEGGISPYEASREINGTIISMLADLCHPKEAFGAMKM